MQLTSVHSFWARVDKNGPTVRAELGPCWLWTGPVYGKGYGRLRFAGRMIAAHRLAWMLLVGAFPQDKILCHHCDTRRCVRPDHLFAGTHQDNMDDMYRKGRARHALGADNGKSKITDGIVREIRRRAATESYADIARSFGIDRANASRIARGLAWSHVTEAA